MKTPSILPRKFIAALVSAGLFLSLWFLIGHHDASEQPRIFTVSSSTASAASLGPTKPHLFDIFVTVSPNPIMDDEDARVSVAISEIASPIPSGRVAVHLEAGGLSVPSDVRMLDLKRGESTLFILSPKGKGRKSFLVSAEYVAPANAVAEPLNGQRKVEKMVDLPVQEQPTTWLLSNKSLATAVAVGTLGSLVFRWWVPGFLQTMFASWFARRGTARRRRPH